MADISHTERTERVVAAAETYFGRPVRRVTAPGGVGRSSLRLHFDRMVLIGTLRPSYRRTHLEAHVLRSLGGFSEDLPECLGVVDDVLFQSDVGATRLSQEIPRRDRPEAYDLAAQAVSAIFRLHSAARKTSLHRMMPHLGAGDGWVESFVRAVDVLEPYGAAVPDSFDRNAACETIAVPARQLVKWDCRSGNAALDRDGRLRWFDFEYSGLRHGAEDLAWLIGDETWPLAPDRMVDVVIDCWDPGAGHDIAAYLEYLSVYLTFHAAQRFALIMAEAQARGWLTPAHVREFDDAGVHPDFVAQICRVGAYFSAQSRVTAPLSPVFEAAGRSFEGVTAGRVLRTG